MTRRRRFVLSSDEDEPQPSTTNDQQQNHLEDDDFQSIHSSPPNPNSPEPVQILSSSEDEQFIDVSDHLSPPIGDQTDDLSSNQTSNTTEGLSSPIGNFLLKMGLGLKSEFIDSCVNGSSRLDVNGKAKVCFEKFLVSDMNFIGNGVLPSNIDSMHLVDLPGPFVLQVDEIVNISCPLKGRYQEVSAGIKRCLKLSMTDGVRRVFGIEFRPIKDLQVFSPAGLKVVICNVHVRHGLLMLVPEALEVLGGMVDELERARQRLVDEVNKPPRGIRSKTRVAPKLATRATLAAWPQNDHNVPGNINSSTNVPRHSDTSFNISRPTNASVLPNATPFVEDNQGANMGERGGTHTSHGISEEFPVPLRAQNTTFISSNGVVSDFEEMHIDPPPVRRESVVSNQQSGYISDHEDECMVNDFERPSILSRDQEVPFTYLSSLSAKWISVKEEAPSVQGKVKCFLTGVRDFQYKERTAYELHVYVDDGSLISEILIDHNIIENRIGYSPQEVTAALSSSDATIVAGMKATMRQFQKFLMNFEGIMLVEMNRTSSLPIALEMNQGCPASDAWLLMRRLKSSSPPQTSHSSSINLIAISP